MGTQQIVRLPEKGGALSGLALSFFVHKVYDWNGRLLRRYELNEPVYRIALVPQQQRIFGISELRDNAILVGRLGYPAGIDPAGYKDIPLPKEVKGDEADRPE